MASTDSCWAAGPDGDFSIKNLPYGIFSVPARGLGPRGGVAIGDSVLDLSVLDSVGLLVGCPNLPLGCFAEPTLNSYMATPRATWKAVRARLIELLSAGGAMFSSNVLPKTHARRCTSSPLSLNPRI